MTEDWNCFTVDLIILNVAFASIDGFLAFIAFAQVFRIHMRSQQNDWTRQKLLFFRIVVLIFVVMMAFSILIYIGDEKNPIDPSVVARVYESFLAVLILILAGALGCYGLLIFFKLRKVRSEDASSEMWKVLSLAVISVICFSSSALVALNTDIPLFYHWHLKFMYGVKAFVFLILYYFIGSSLPSAYLLWIIRELPPPVTDITSEEPRGTLTFISHTHEASGSNQPWSWTIATSSKNQISRASPI